MARKHSEEIVTRTIRQRQKNGDIYVIERKTQYDPEKKYNVVLSSKIIGKIPLGQNQVVPTRPKRPNREKVSNLPVPFLTARRMRIGMMDIIDHIGKVSGIDEAIYANTDLGTAQKILSLARYLLATDGQSLPGITAWQYSHPIPYEDGISEDIYHELFCSVGKDESLMQSFFASRLQDSEDEPVLAYDSTTVSTYSQQLPEARYGFNKAHDGLETVKLLTLYSIDKRLPVAFAKQPGNQPDVITIENALKQMQALNIGNAEIVTDNGYYSEKNLAELLYAHFDFITLAKINLQWIKPELNARLDEFRSTSSACPFDTNTHGISVMLMQEFSRVRKYGSRKKDLKEGDEETFRRRIYLHLYFNPMRRVEQDTAFDNDLFELKELIEGGKSEQDLKESAWKKVQKFLFVRHYGSKITVTFNEKTIAEEKKYHGYFALVSNCEKDPFECLRKYRKRGVIEFFFESGKQRADGSRTRVCVDRHFICGWIVIGVFCLFVALFAACYEQSLHPIDSTALFTHRCI